MPQYLAPTAPVPTTHISTTPISQSHAQTLLSNYLLATTSSQPWSHSHDAGTTASLRKIELSLRGIHGPDANTYLTLVDEESKLDTDEGGETERRRVNETVEDIGESSDDGLAELQNVKRDDEVLQDAEEKDEEMEGEAKVIDKEERKRLKKERKKDDKRRKEAERRGDLE